MGVQHAQFEFKSGLSQSSTKFFNENTRNELQLRKAFACSLTAELFAGIRIMISFHTLIELSLL